MLLSWLVSAVYFAVDWWKDRLFRALRVAADPSFDPSNPYGDMDAYAKWMRFEQLFDLALVLLLMLPGWWSLTSSWRFVVTLSLPRVRRKATVAVRWFLAFERGYRASQVLGSARERSWASLASHASVLACLLMAESEPLLAPLLMLRHFGALWQSLFTLFGLDERVPRVWFSNAVASVQIALIVLNVRPSASPWFLLLVAVFVVEKGRALVASVVSRLSR